MALGEVEMVKNDVNRIANGHSVVDAYVSLNYDNMVNKVW